MISLFIQPWQLPGDTRQMPKSDTTIVTLNSQINLTRKLNESVVSSRFIAKNRHEKKDNRHISFMEQVKLIYFDFNQPVSTPARKELEMKNLNFLYHRNEDKPVCVLETFKLKNYNMNTVDTLIRLEGTVLVKNFAYEKKVNVRYSLTEWETFSDIKGFYIDSLNKEWDRFAFVIRIDPVLFTLRDYIIISMAIKYETMNTVYWDNNFNENHRFIINLITK